MKKLKDKNVIFILEQMALTLKEGKLEITVSSKKEKEKNKKRDGKKVCFDAVRYFDDPVKEFTLYNPSIFAPIVAQFHIERKGKGPLFSFRQGIKLCHIVPGDHIPDEDAKLFGEILQHSTVIIDNESMIRSLYKKISQCIKIVSEKRQKETTVKIGELNYFK